MPVTMPDALAILSAMITPAVLITAAGSLILTTSQRLSRVIDRARKLMVRIDELREQELAGTLHSDEQDMVDAQIAWATYRARLLQRALSSLYITLSVFVATMVVLGLLSALQQSIFWLPVGLGLIGALLLLYASLLLLQETRLAVRAVNAEMAFVLAHRRTRA